MSTQTQSPQVPTSPLDDVYRFTVEQFDRMVKAGTLGEDDHVELLAGLVVRKRPKNPRHRVSVRKVLNALEPLIPSGWHVEKEESLLIPPLGKPEPDVAVLRRDIEFDASRDATADDCCLIVEAADNQLSRARQEKLQLYAAAGIPVYWIVNLVGGTPTGTGQIEVYTDPDHTGKYRTRATFHLGDKVPVVIQGNELGKVLVRDLLP